MGGKTDNFAGDLIFKTSDNCHGHNHNRQSQANPKDGNVQYGPRNAFPVIFAEDQLPGYEDLSIHKKMSYFMR